MQNPHADDGEAVLEPAAALRFMIGGLVVFLAAVSLKSLGALDGLDSVLLLALREAGDTSQPVGPLWLEQAVVQFTALGGYTVTCMLAAAIAGGLLVAGKPRTALVAPVALASAIVVENALKGVFLRPRPDIVAHLVETHTMSFPSGHAMIGTVAYLTFGLIASQLTRDRAVRRYVLAVAISIAFLLGLSRLYLGVHWPSDVIAGWALGLAWTCFVWRLMARRF